MFSFFYSFLCLYDAYKSICALIKFGKSLNFFITEVKPQIGSHTIRTYFHDLLAFIQVKAMKFLSTVFIYLSFFLERVKKLI